MGSVALDDGGRQRHISILLVVLLSGLKVPLMVMIVGGCMEGEMSFIGNELVV